MATSRKTTTYFCGWCSTGQHAKCLASGTCACAKAEHEPDTTLQRLMLASQAPDLAPAIARGVFDKVAVAWYLHTSPESV